MLSYLCKVRSTLPVLIKHPRHHQISHIPGRIVAHLHTSPPKKAVPPAFFIFLRPLAKGLAFLTGRSIRKWWRALPKEKKDLFWSRTKEKKWKIASGYILSSVFAYSYYVSHLEKTPITGRERFVSISPKQIQKLSDIEFKMLCENYKDQIVKTSHPVYSHVAEVVNRLLKANKDIPQVFTKTWTITVLDEPKTINAFVLPNGNIFVFTGMLNLCSSDDELGIILGHEMSHSLLGHAAENVSRENVVDSLKVIILFLLSAILPTDLLTWMSYAIGAGAASTLLRYPYERSLEEEADKVGIQLAAKACFDVRAASAFWGKMDALEDCENDDSIDWLSSHPSHKVRQKNVEDLLHDANTLRSICECPDLPAEDPRKEIEAFRKAVLEVRQASLQRRAVLISVGDKLKQ